MDLSMSAQEEEELLEMFSFEAQEMHQQLNELFTSFEANPENDEVIDEIFRITHTLKGSAMGMGYVGIADISHVMEDIFTAIKTGELETSKSIFTSLYKACDKLGELIANIKTKKKISHKGIKTKLEVILRKIHSNPESSPESGSQTTQDDRPEGKDMAQEETITEATQDDELEHESFNSDPADELPIDNQPASGWERWKQKLRKLFQPSSNHEEESQERFSEQAIEAEEPYEVESAQEASNPEWEGEQSTATESEPSPDGLEMADSRPSLTENDENSVLNLLDGMSAEIAEEDTDLLKNIQDKVAITDLVQVPIRKLDNLMNQVGQLIIERDRLMAINAVNGQRNTEYAGLQRITSDLQYSVMDVRLVQIGTLFNKFHRIARDVAAIENKQVQLKVKGTEVEIDRNILKIMSDSMVHLIRNAVSHGIESPEDRERLNKPEEATITLNARSEKDNVIIEVTDDGKGIDAAAIRKKILEKGMVTQEYADQLSDDEVIMFIFESGFSNAEKVNEISGRGVGMDVVKNSTESIGGQILIDTEVGVGTTISLKLPSSMAVKGVLLFQMGEQEFAFALAYTEAVISLYKKDIHKAGIGLMSSYLKQTISVVFFSDLFNMKDFSEVYEQGTFHKTFDSYKDDQKFDVIVVSYGNKFIGIVVDKLLQQKEIIEKTIPKPLDNNKLLSGTTILGNGNVCLVVDVVAIADILYKSKLKVHETKNVS
ncbi:MAG: chemotaxis protein CheA [Reichenbachiella sp.]|uniref:chemotaxis protein CheA n=3 Tax=Reichenbachiella sp. TaxID=2184521 RepID=UPI00326563B9